MLAVYLSPIYIIANSYLLIRLHRWLGTCNPLFRKTGICVAISLAYVFLVASLLIAFFLPIGPARRIMKLISNYWLGILLYLILAVLMADAICFLLFLITKRRLKCRTAAAGGICAVVVLVLSAWGAYNARIIQVTPYEITVNKDGGRLENLNVVFAGDIFDNEYEGLHVTITGNPGTDGVYGRGSLPISQRLDEISRYGGETVPVFLCR